MTKPTRRDLLLVIGELQDIIGGMVGSYLNDRGAERSQPIQDLGERGMRLCIDARSFDPPLRGKWPR